MRAFPASRTLPRARWHASAGVALWLALSACLPAPALAEKADRNKPINVEADRMQYDDLKQINVFTGNVVLTKGTILLRADRLVIRQDPEGYQYGTATGNLAFFRQKREGVDQFVEGQARQIDYDGKRETFRLQQQAMMRRTENERVVDEVHGSDILYESRNEFFTVEGTSGTAATPGNPAGRVRVIIQPRDAAPAAPAAPGEATPLKPAEQLAPPRGSSSR
ncbi:MAG: lipopolysaccharide transport periplasmic protein LptA [Burkholderiaceae bacterium]|jgi:lipopolysaccharide export system protein LptA|nr:lipopolysaccharide transport periplasmic protein LptA [Burkholderiaceae bacterium]